MRLSTWRLAGLGFVTFSAAGVIAAVVLGLFYGLLWGAGAYASTFLVLLGVMSAAARVAPAAATELEEWQLAPPPSVPTPAEAESANTSPAATQAPSGRPARRMSDKITMMFEQACEVGDVTLAEKLLESLELVLLRGPSAVEERALRLEVIIAGRNRLAAMRSPEQVRTATEIKTDA